MYYRVLLSGIPASIDCVEFYDYLRIHHGGQDLVNALLLGQPSEAIGVTANSGATSRSSSPLHCGAAVVDYATREAAEACAFHELKMNGTAVNVQLLGTSVIRDVAAESVLKTGPSSGTRLLSFQNQNEDDVVVALAGMPVTTTVADVHFFLENSGIYVSSVEMIAPGNAHVVLSEGAADLLKSKLGQIAVNGESVLMVPVKRPLCTAQYAKASPADILQAMANMTKRNEPILADKYDNIFLQL